MSIPFTISRDAISVFLYGYPTVIQSTHPNYAKVLEALKTGVTTPDDVLALEKLINIASSVKEAVKGSQFGDITVGQDAILYRGNPINNYLTESMLQIIKQGLDVKPWANFMDLLYKNPSKTAVEELFLWLDKAGMPITEDGHFLAYKKVQDDFSSYHKGPGGLIVLNLPGSIVEMPRNEVDDNRTKTCSTGLHFCSWHYLPSYYGNRGKVVLVKINPSDVVSIPSDYDNSKGRATKYEVIGVIDEKATEFAFANTTVYGDDDPSEWVIYDFPL